MESVPFMGIPNLDKLVHAFLFGVLAWLILQALVNRKTITPKILIAVFLIVSLYGAAMEFYQDYFTTREFESMDIAADTLGAALVLAWSRYKKISPYRNRGRNQN